MVHHTDAYLRLKTQAQASFDFAVVVCSSVPALKLQMSLVDRGVIPGLPRPDYFSPNGISVPQLRDQVKDYKGQLARHLLLSSFTFFETFVGDAIREMLNFHGGADSFQQRARLREAGHVGATVSKEVDKARRVLFSANKPMHGPRYRKYTGVLAAAGYPFPSDFFSGYGIQTLIHKLGNLRAVDIPDLLRNGLCMPLSQTAVDRFHAIRDIRNRIAHGERVSMSLAEAAKMNDDLRETALSVDQHLVTYFMVSEEYRYVGGVRLTSVSSGRAKS